MASEPAVDLEAGVTPALSDESEGEHTSSADNAAAGNHPQEFQEMVKHPWGLALSLYWAMSACMTLVVYNTLMIFSGHVLIRYYPIPISLLPSRRAFVSSSLTSTLAMAALGTTVLAIPVFVTGMVVVGFVVGMRLGSLAILRTVIHLHHTLRSSRIMPPHPETPLFQVWLVAAGPIGSLVYEVILPGSKDHLSTMEMLVAAALPRALWYGGKFVGQHTQRVLAPPMPELRPADAPPGLGPPPAELRRAETAALPEQSESKLGGAPAPAAVESRDASGESASRVAELDIHAADTQEDGNK